MAFPADLTHPQLATLAQIQRTNARLYHAYLLKEQLRMVFHQDTPEQAITLLDRWLAWAGRCQIPAFVKLSRTIREHKVGIYAAIVNQHNNARAEQINTRIRLLTRVASGFHSSAPRSALAMLALGGLCPSLPDESGPHTSVRKAKRALMGPRPQAPYSAETWGGESGSPRQGRGWRPHPDSADVLPDEPAGAAARTCPGRPAARTAGASDVRHHRRSSAIGSAVPPPAAVGRRSRNGAPNSRPHPVTRYAIDHRTYLGRGGLPKKPLGLCNPQPR